MTMRFLPALDSSLQPPRPSAGDDWGDHPAGLGVLSQYSNALSVPDSDTPPERLKSVPSPWARLLLFEQALYSKRHPAHKEIQNEWRGLLGAIALSQHLGIEVRAVGMDLEHSPGIGRTLLTMAPRGDEAIWGRMGLLFLGDRLVGGTSARTLVFTGIRPSVSGKVPFQERGFLTDPTEYYISNNDRASLALLSEWLRSTRSQFDQGAAEFGAFLGTSTAGKQSSALPRLGSLLRLWDEWESDTRAGLESIGAPAFTVSDGFVPSGIGDVFAPSHPGHAAFARIHHIRPAEFESENSLRVEGGTDVALPGVTGELMRNEHLFSGSVALPQGMTRKVLNGRFELATGATEIRSTWPDLGALFETKLIPVEDSAGGVVQSLTLGGQSYLFPFKPEVLRYLTPEQLLNWVKVRGDVATGATVSLEIPLANGLRVVYKRRYTSGDAYDSSSVATPLVAVWPDFHSSAWKHYFYMIRHPGRANRLKLDPIVGGPIVSHDEDRDGLSWGETQSPPTAWRGTFGAYGGLLLGPRLPNVIPSGVPWNVSIDFGSTHTRVFRQQKDASGNQKSDEVPLKRRARSLFRRDTSIEFNFFVDPETSGGSQAEAPSLVWLPLERPVSLIGRTEWLPPDGVMYWGAVQDAPDTKGLRGNLKWRGSDPQEKASFHSFVSQLYLAIAAEAASEGAAIETIITAYPSVLTSNLQHLHKMEWKELEPKFNVKVKDPLSESEALASFLARDEGAPIAANLLAVDIGGSTSDITIWSGNKWAQGDSVRLAGDILGRLVVSDADARGAISEALARPPFNYSPLKWDAKDPSKNELIFNSVLRTVSQNARYPDEKDLLARNLCAPGSAGERVVAHVAFLFGAIGFLIGMMVKKNGIVADRFEIRFAGKGSEFMHWLDALHAGASRTLPAAFFRAGHGSLDSQTAVECIPPGSMAKQEVGRGLLRAVMAGERGSTDHETFFGESGFVGPDGPLDWSASLTFDRLKSMARPPVPTSMDHLQSLRKFVDVFQSDPAARKAAASLGLSAASLNNTLRDQIHTRLFGPESAWEAAHKDGAKEDALLEPFFITEAKVLLQAATKKSLFFR